MWRYECDSLQQFYYSPITGVPPITAGVAAEPVAGFFIFPVIKPLILRKKAQHPPGVLSGNAVEIAVEIHHVPIQAGNWEMILSQAENSVIVIKQVIPDTFQWDPDPGIGGIRSNFGQLQKDPEGCPIGWGIVHAHRVMPVCRAQPFPESLIVLSFEYPVYNSLPVDHTR
jgi:hypothetical protein